ncbi:beta-ketoacyl synthase chain length factor [Trinickia fusca]|uniref:Beta-ketoacyl synthase-like N-terminal domain-containing protein n=1 Tax=Trinickia fusca TaxID=2419777 RepID=A0A494XJ08_9BURK|nr:beta-ketoacyl synthase chain length factor [Trinickia fusca]RKP50717.1 hypothetical protein D7S89_06425 [Trinickia fusca]
MLDLRLTIPVARWSFWPAAEAKTPELPFVEPIVRRRLSALSKMALKVAYDCAAQYDAVRVIFASRHGELRRTASILDALASDQPVSPTAFSLSVLNAMTGIYGIVRGDRSPATAIAAGAETLGYALLEAHAQWHADPATPVLVVYADEPADPRYGHVDHEVGNGALALLLDGDAPGHLECIARGEAESTDDAASIARGFPTQSEAVVHCLEARAPAAWRALGRHWQWHWREGGAI